MLIRLGLALIVGLGALAAVRVSGEADLITHVGKPKSERSERLLCVLFNKSCVALQVARSLRSLWLLSGSSKALETR